MNGFVKVVNGEIICTKSNHNDPVFMVIMDNDTPLNDRTLCQKCYKSKNQITKNSISIEKAQELIQEKIQKINSNTQEIINRLTTYLNKFLLEMIDHKRETINLYDQILNTLVDWISDVEQLGENQNANSLWQNFELLYSNKVENNQFEEINNSRLKKIISPFTQLSNHQNHDRLLQLEQYIKQHAESIDITQKQMVKSVQFSHSIKQDEWAKAITFNSTGTLMIAGCDEHINVWKFNQGLVGDCKKLQGINGIIQCLACSPTDNWFASGSDDGWVCCWKENQEWICLESEKQHKSQVLGLLVYQQQIISCSRDKTIIVWKIDHQNNRLVHDYTLANGHQKEVLGISLNSEVSQLVSCSSDKQIILWVKGTNNKWTFSSSLIMQDFGYRICFLGLNMIAWQQYSKGFTHILESKDGQLIIRSDLNIELSQDQFDVSILFPTIYNKKKQILIQKHNKFVYILQNIGNCKFQNVSYPIECSHQFSYGALTEEGDYLVVWNYNTKVFRFYNIAYE